MFLRSLGMTRCNIEEKPDPYLVSLPDRLPHRTVVQVLRSMSESSVNYVDDCGFIELMISDVDK